MGDGRSPIATREIYTTPKNQIKMKNRMPSRVDAFVYKTRVTTNVWRSGARIPRIPTTRALSHANTWACGSRTGEASNLEHQRGRETRRDAVGGPSEGSRGDRLVRWLEESKHLSTFFLFFFFGCSCGSVGVGLQTQDDSVVTSTTQKSHNLESSIQSRSVAALLLESG